MAARTPLGRGAGGSVSAALAGSWREERRARRHRCLAGAGAGLNDEMSPGCDRVGDGLCHALLPGPVLVTGERGGDLAPARRPPWRPRPSLPDERDRGVEVGGVEVGPGAPVKWILAPAPCQSRKFETRSSPLVRTITSTGGSSGM